MHSVKTLDGFRYTFSYPGGTSGKELACQCKRPDMQVDSWVRKIPWRRKWQAIPVFLPEDLMDGGNWWAIVHGVTKSGHNLANKPATNWSTAIYYVIYMCIQFYFYN